MNRSRFRPPFVAAAFATQELGLLRLQGSMVAWGSGLASPATPLRSKTRRIVVNVAALARRSAMVEMEKAERDYEFLRECFCEVLHEIGESEVAQVLSPAAGAGVAIHSQAAAQAHRSVDH